MKMIELRRVVRDRYSVSAENAHGARSLWTGMVEAAYEELKEEGAELEDMVVKGVVVRFSAKPAEVSL